MSVDCRLQCCQLEERVTDFNDSCYPWFLAVAVVKESQLPFFHLPHKIACLKMMDNLEECSHREKESKNFIIFQRDGDNKETHKALRSLISS